MAVASVNSSTSSASLLTVNTSRKYAAIRNTDANVLYVLLDEGTASATNHTVALLSGDFFEVPSSYKGAIYGIWAGDGSGVALVTSF